MESKDLSFISLLFNFIGTCLSIIIIIVEVEIKGSE
jgi:hypothetical protein